MLCFVIDKREFDKETSSGYKVTNKYVCIGSVKNKEHAEKIARTFTCFTEVKILGRTLNKCCYIVCNI